MKKIGYEMLLTIDPGQNSGFAIFDNRELVWCDKNPPPSAWLDGVEFAVIEQPVIYPHGKTPNPNDIVQLAYAAGQMAGSLTVCGVHVTAIAPRTWKGTIDKGTCCRRVWGRLTATERAVAERFEPEPSGKVRKGKDHILDAIGIGLFTLERLRVH